MTDEMLKTMASAPEEVKQAAVTLRLALARFRKSRNQIELWRKERNSAKAYLELAQYDWAQVQSRWDRESNTMAETLEHRN